MPLEDLRLNLIENKISIADAIVKALPELKNKETDATMMWLSNELQGYRNSLDYYYQENPALPEYRVINGSLKLMNKNGKLVELQHPLADRSKYFLGAPVAWLEESATLPGDFSMTELPELSHDKSKGEMIILEYTHTQLQNTLAEIKKRLLDLLK